MLKSYKWDEFRSISLVPDDSVAEPPVFASRFCRIQGYEHLLALANEDGKIALRDTSKNSSASYKVTSFQGHMNAIFDLSWSESQLRLVSVSGDHTAMLWDVSGSTVAPLGMFEGHTRSVKVAAFRPEDSNVFATGARDGLIIVWDYRCPQSATATIKPDNIISNAHCQSGSIQKKNRRKEPSRAESITGLAFQDSNRVISCSAGDGVIKVWDLRKCYSMHRKLPQACYSLYHPGTSTRNGFTSLCVDPGAVRLFANCMDNNIYCFNIATYEKSPVSTYYGHQNQTFYIKSCLSVDGEYLLSGSSDEKGYLWRVKRPGPPLAHLIGHSAEVTCVDWATPIGGNLKLVTCADDACYLVWRLSPPTDNEVKDPNLVGWIEWADTTPTTKHSITTPRSIQRMVRRHYITPDSYQDKKRHKTSERNVLSAVQPCSDSSKPRRLFDEDTSPSCSGVEVLSPTSNLPNYVVEGTSPYHRCTSASKQKENWLSRLQNTPSPRPRSPRRLVPRKSTNRVCGNLLNFFKVAAKPQTPESKVN